MKNGNGNGKRNSVMGAIAAFMIIGGAILMAGDVDQALDNMVHTPTEAILEHEEIQRLQRQVQTEQADYNRYFLSQILRTEIEVLIQKIRNEDDPERIEELRKELEEKRELRRKMEDRQRDRIMERFG